MSCCWDEGLDGVGLWYFVGFVFCFVLFYATVSFVVFVVFVVCFLSCTTRIRYVDYAAVSDETSVEATE